MAKIEFDYEAWDNKKDVPLERPGNTIGYSAIHDNVYPGYVASTRDRDRRDSFTAPTIEGVIGLLAGALEWCRQYKLSAKEVESKVKAYMRDNRGSNESEFWKTVQKELYDLSDEKSPKNYDTNQTL